ncbi:MAG TPA: hypothetical protein VFL93_00410 [Longimicrobiaceae bacterium]|nr:hypothetical protein [Longimicrobiaceae bacterium]
MKSRTICLLGIATLLSACGPADDVRVQALPPLKHASLEARAGLPEVSGLWRFAGWELAPGDSADLSAPLPGFGSLWLRTQKRDSLAGLYVTSGGRAPLVGEARRDSVLSLVTVLAPGDARFLAGELARDTLWLELTSLVDPAAWPNGARAAFVRSPVASTFVRIQGAPVPVPAESALVDTTTVAAPATPAPVTAEPTPATPTPAMQQPATRQPAPAPSGPTRPTPTPPAPPAQASPPSTPAQQPPAATPTPAQPKPAPDTAKPRKIHLLGEPVDSAGP